jgi:hypothetical protein
VLAVLGEEAGQVAAVAERAQNEAERLEEGGKDDRGEGGEPGATGRCKDPALTTRASVPFGAAARTVLDSPTIIAIANAASSTANVSGMKPGPGSPTCAGIRVAPAP